MPGNDSHSLNILAIRFSAIGDVAMTVPVLDSFARQYPQHHITFLSNPRFEPFFSGMPSNFTFRGADVKKQYHGTSGLKLLVSELAASNYDTVLDLHGVLRSEYISTGLMLKGCRVYRIGKDRIGREAVTRRILKRTKPLASAFERYGKVFTKAGFDIDIAFKNIFCNVPDGILSEVGAKEQSWIGIAPFAAHKGKIYPLELMERVVSGLQQKPRWSRIFVFAYGDERAQVEQWPVLYNKVTLISGQYDMGQELQLMYWLDCMVCMDSSNMHLASLAGTRVVSVWGATHPVAGFLGYGQSVQDCVQLDMDCRPCSIYGKKECRFGDYRCMSRISPDSILSLIDRI